MCWLLAHMKRFSSLTVLLIALLWADVAESRIHVKGPSLRNVWLDKDMSEVWPTESAVVDHLNAKPAKHESKYPYIAAIHEDLSKVFGKYSEHWWQDWKLWIGLSLWLAVWAKWLKNGYRRTQPYWERALFAFGLNIAILHQLQYATTIKKGMLVVCAVLSAQSLLQSVTWFKTEVDEDEKAKLQKGTPRSVEGKIYADTLYLDLSLPVEQICVLFVAQLCIWWFYMTSILSNFRFSHVNYCFWLVAYLAMQMTMIFNRGDDSVLGNPFPCHDVYRLIMTCDKVTLQLEGSEEEASEKFKISKVNVIMRGLMGFFCNAILREIMAYTIPLMLMGFAEPMDFVVYCVGVNFICTIDDMTPRQFLSQAPIE